MKSATGNMKTGHIPTAARLKMTNRDTSAILATAIAKLFTSKPSASEASEDNLMTKEQELELFNSFFLLTSVTMAVTGQKAERPLA